MSSSNPGENRLTEKQKAVLFAAYSILDQRMNMHVSKQKIQNKMKGRAQFKIKKPLNELVAKGLLREGPTKGGMTYYPTSEGVDVARELFPLLFLEY